MDADVAACYSGTTTSANMPSLTSSSILWVRVTQDGTNFSVKCLASSTAPTETAWSGAGACFTSTSVPAGGGMLGFGSAWWNYALVDNVTIKSYNPGTSSFDTTELEEHFTVDGSGYASDTLPYDNNGNLTYDGTQAYAYDAWNRLATIAHAYRAFSADGGDGNVHAGLAFCRMGYDAAGRRSMSASAIPASAFAVPTPGGAVGR